MVGWFDLENAATIHGLCQAYAYIVIASPIDSTNESVLFLSNNSDFHVQSHMCRT